MIRDEARIEARKAATKEPAIRRAMNREIKRWFWLSWALAAVICIIGGALGRNLWMVGLTIFLLVSAVGYWRALKLLP